MVVVFFTEDGLIQTCHRLTALGAGEKFMVRLESPVYHTVIILTETVVFLETVLGPHEETLYAKFAPKPDELETAQEYLACLEKHTMLF
jgi:cupin fold WbuC family metalloprotein